ncbi:MAG: NERD domain-containing protein [Chloroflexi bacterium]|nr:NERD domain-containing protein [Chloroflexota bacterium]
MGEKRPFISLSSACPHVLLTRQGVIVFNLRPNIGKISVDENDKWRQSGGIFRRLFGQEPLGNPTSEIDKMVEAMAGYIRQNAPTVEELPIGALIVFTTKGATELDLENSTIPAMRATKVKGFLRQQKREPLPKADYDALRAAFDEKSWRFGGVDPCRQSYLMFIV